MDLICFLLCPLWLLAVLGTLLMQLSPDRKKKSGLFRLWLAFLIGFPLLVGLNAFWDPLWPGRLTVPSPGEKYALEQRFTGFLTIGYRGNTYLVVDETHYFVDDWGPGNAYWVGETSFVVGQTTYFVNDLIQII